MLWYSRKLVTPLECALTKNAPANPLESALANSLDLKPFAMNRCKKGGGRGVLDQLRALPSALRTQADLSPWRGREISLRDSSPRQTPPKLGMTMARGADAAGLSPEGQGVPRRRA
jgi:hypothetical protein